MACRGGVSFLPRSLTRIAKCLTRPFHLLIHACLSIFTHRYTLILTPILSTQTQTQVWWCLIYEGGVSRQILLPASPVLCSGAVKFLRKKILIIHHTHKHNTSTFELEGLASFYATTHCTRQHPRDTLKDKTHTDKRTQGKQW